MRTTHLLATAALAAALALTGCSNNGQKTQSQQDHEAARKQWAGARANLLGNVAKEQFDGGNFDKARETTNNALKIDPDNAPLRVLSARIAIEQGDLELADKELVLARRLAPKNADADYLGGVICQRWQRFQDAYDFYRSAAEKQPNELAYVLAQSEALVLLNRADDALSLLQSRVVYFESSATIRDAIGQLLMQKGKYEQAVDMFRQASLLATDDNNVREHLALALVRTKEFREGGDVLTRLLKDERYAKRADLYLALGECLLNSNRARDARTAFETASNINPNQASIWMALGKCALQLNDPRRAEIAIRRAITIEPANSEAHLLIGYVRLRQNKQADALAAFRKASALDPNDTVSLCMIGYVLERSGKPRQALEYYAQALKLKPHDEMATRLMADVQLNQ